MKILANDGISNAGIEALGNGNHALLLMNESELNHFQGIQGALEHHRSTTVVFYELIEFEQLKKYMMDVVSHEFFHTLTPLNIHSSPLVVDLLNKHSQNYGDFKSYPGFVL